MEVTTAYSGRTTYLYRGYRLMKKKSVVKLQNIYFHLLLMCTPTPPPGTLPDKYIFFCPSQVLAFFVQLLYVLLLSMLSHVAYTGNV